MGQVHENNDISDKHLTKPCILVVDSIHVLRLVASSVIAYS